MPASPQSKQIHSDRNNGVSLFGCSTLEAGSLLHLPLSLTGGAAAQTQTLPQRPARGPGKPGPPGCPAPGKANTPLPVHRLLVLEVAGPSSLLPKGGGGNSLLCWAPPIQNGHLPLRVPAAGSLKAGASLCPKGSRRHRWGQVSPASRLLGFAPWTQRPSRGRQSTGKARRP